MRSRNGSNYFSLSIFIILLFNLSVSNADEYHISYRYVVKDAILYNEKLQISKAMTKCHGSSSGQNQLILKNINNNLKSVISTNFQQFINYIHKIGIEVKHQDKTIDGLYTSTTILTLRTTCFQVDFNEKFVKISPLR